MKEENTIKITDAPEPPCNCPEHNPPNMKVFDPGTYKHMCPKCGEVQTFTVDPIYF